MDDKVTVAEVAQFLNHDLPILEKALLWVGVAEGKWFVVSNMCIDVFLRWFGEVPLEIGEQLQEIETFAHNLGHSHFFDWHVSPDDLAEMRKKIDDLLHCLDFQYAEAGIYNLGKLRREDIPV